MPAETARDSEQPLHLRTNPNFCKPMANEKESQLTPWTEKLAACKYVQGVNSFGHL